MVTIHNTPQNSEEWLQARIGKFTGSNAIKLLKHGRTDRQEFKRQSSKATNGLKEVTTSNPMQSQLTSK